MKASKKPVQVPETFPMRLNRFMALKGLSTRRGADELIESGRVRINGQVARLGDKVASADTLVTLDRNEKEFLSDFVYYAYYKPRGIITHSPQRGERSIRDVSGLRDVFPVGRLDKDSEGLILLTNDGRITERLLSPRFEHEKEYVVNVQETLPRDIVGTLEQGIQDEGETLHAKRVTFEGKHTLRIILTEGKKHQIRRMLAASGLTVTELSRVRIMGVHLGSLRPGEKRMLAGKSKAGFLHDLGLE